MTQSDHIEIPLSKKKVLLLFFGAVAFVVLGVLFLLNPSMFVSPMYRSPIMIFIVGLALQINFDSLHKLLTEKMKEYKQRNF